MTRKTKLIVACAALLAACDDPGPPEATPDRYVPPAATPARTAAPSVTATATAAPTQEPAPTATAEPEPAPSTTATAAPSGSASASAASKGFAFPSPKTGILTQAQADKLAAVGSAAKIRLLDAGAEPLAKIAYSPSKGTTVPLRIDMGTKVAVVTAGQPGASAAFPPQAVDIDVQTEDTGDAGGAVVAMLLRGMTTQAKDGVDQATADALTKQLAGLRGYTVRQRVSAHGETSDAKVVLPDTFPKGAEQLLQNINSTFRALIPRLPEEPVGKGAKWQVLSREEAPGTSFVQLTELTLKERNGDKATLDYSARQLAAGDTVKLPAGLGDGQSMKLAKFSTTITGTLEIDTSQLGPVKGRSSQTAKLSFLVTAPGAAGAGAEQAKADVEMKLTAAIARRSGGAAPASISAPASASAPAEKKP